MAAKKVNMLEKRRKENLQTWFLIAKEASVKALLQWEIKNKKSEKKS